MVEGHWPTGIPSPGRLPSAPGVLIGPASLEIGQYELIYLGPELQTQFLHNQRDKRMLVDGRKVTNCQQTIV